MQADRKLTLSTVRRPPARRRAAPQLYIATPTDERQAILSQTNRNFIGGNFK